MYIYVALYSPGVNSNKALSDSRVEEEEDDEEEEEK